MASPTAWSSMNSSTAVNKVRSNGVHTAAAGPSVTASICRRGQAGVGAHAAVLGPLVPRTRPPGDPQNEQLACPCAQLGVGAGEHLGEGEPGRAEREVMGEHLEHDRHGWRIGCPRQVDLGPTQELQQRGAGLLVPFGERDGREPRFGPDGVIGHVRGGRGSPVPSRRRNWGPAAREPRRDGHVRLRQLALGHVEPPGGEGRTELDQHGPEVDLDREGVVGAGTGHHRHDGHALQIGGAEPVEKGLQEAGVAGLVGGRRHHDQRAGADPVVRPP